MSTPASEEKKLKWQTLVEQQRQSGLSIEKWCQQNQIHPSTFHYWKDKFFPKQLQKSSFTELNIKRSDAISLQARGLCIRIGRDCDPHLRKTLFAMFAGLAC
jgi:transposase-like protein